ncbi:MAG TPA: tyrosine-protein phosphatase [Clostridiales bacterium]|nr:tyrosine-protein phosphatase [Clostridiales bacterium]
MILPFQNIKNGRELGGLTAADGKKTKCCLLLRTGELFTADEKEILSLSEDYKIKTVIDFRDHSECEIRPDKEIPGAVYHQIPILPPQPEEIRDQLMAMLINEPKATFLRIYENIAENSDAAAAYCKFFQVILENQGVPLLYHCRQGKDRTGIASILLLSALGVPEEEVLKDYFLTNELLKADYEALKAQGTPEDQLEKAKDILFVMEECVHGYLGLLKKNWGSINGYLQGALCLGQEDLKTLRAIYTE